MSHFEKKTNEDATVNPKYVDVLEEDKPIAGQKFTCLSFISPEKIKALESEMEKLGLIEKDIKESFISGSGSGGQKINKTQNCVYLILITIFVIKYNLFKYV